MHYMYNVQLIMQNTQNTLVHTFTGMKFIFMKQKSNPEKGQGYVDWS